MGNFLFFFTVLSVALWLTLKPSSEQSSDDTNTILAMIKEMEEEQRHNLTEIKENEKLPSEIRATSAHSFDFKNCNTQDLSDYEGLDIPRNATVEHSRTLDVRCRRGFVLSSTSAPLTCDDGIWHVTADPCIKGHFHAAFYAEVSHDDRYIECHSDSNADEIEFSRVVDTGSGEDLPRWSTQSTSEKSARLDLSRPPWAENIGAYRCESAAEEGSADLIVPYQNLILGLYFWDPSPVASVGDNVTLRLHLHDKSLLILWSRDGEEVPSWEERKEVFIQNVKPEDAGIYSARSEDRDEDWAIAHLSIRRCKANVYGENCDQICPPCYNGGICHDLLGVCVCPEGFVGGSCEIPCPEGFRGDDCSTACGQRKCTGRFYCKPSPYGCSCTRGFKGAWCDEACNRGWYGAHCKQPCHCAEGGDCNRFTGSCSGGCAPGWKGVSCQIRDDV